LLGALEWVDQGRTYDGMRFSYGSEGDYLDLFGFRTKDSAVSDEDDQDMVGLYGGTKDVFPHINLEAYALLYRDQVRPIIGGVPQPLHAWEDRFVTLGTRVFGEADQFDYSGEYALQIGEVGSSDGEQDLLASAFAIRGGYTIEESPIRPRLGAEVDYASGDRRPDDGDSQQFQVLFPTNHIHYGYADLAAWSNLWDFRGTLSVRPDEELLLSFDWHHFLLADTNGGWINAAGQVVRPGASGVSSHLAEEMDLTLTWSPLKALDFLMGWSRFFPGGFVEDTGRDPASDFVYMQVRLLF